MKRKILYIITQGHWGGAQKYVAELATALKDEFDITVACGEHSAELFGALDNAKIKTTRVRHLVRAISPLKDIQAVFETVRLLKLGNFDIVHANSTKAGFIAALAHAWVRAWAGHAAASGGNQKIHTPHMTQSGTAEAHTPYAARLVYTAHGWIFLEPLSWFKKEVFIFMERIASRARDATIVLSCREQRIALTEKTAREQTLFVIPNGIAPQPTPLIEKQAAKNALAVRATHKNPQNDAPFAETNSPRPWIGAISNLYATKGIDVLIQAAVLLGERGISPLPYFFVIGEGPERARLQKLIHNACLDDSFFLIGAIQNAARLLRAFDIFVLPSRKEGFSYALLEAAASGVPIVATDAGAAPEIIRNNENGLLVSAGESIELAHALSRLLHDTPLSLQLAAHAPTIAQQFSLDTTIVQTKKLYHQLLN